MPVFAVLALLSASSVGSDITPFDLSARTIIGTFHAEGAQVYECEITPHGTGLAWTFREPIATLMDGGKTVGRHFAGPRWALDDGSLVQARVAETGAGATPGDIPILKLDVVQNSGSGGLAAAREVYRLNTRSGVLQGACGVSGELRSIAYSADYVFAR
jgi:hypothetical protein